MALAEALASGRLAGWDDVGSSNGRGRTFASLEQLWAVQAEERDAYYAANRCFWDEGGYRGESSDEAMIGDDGSAEDLAASGAFLDRLLARRTATAVVDSVLDVGAGAGRVAAGLLLPRSAVSLHLVEGCRRWSDESRRRLGSNTSVPVTTATEDDVAAAGADAAVVTFEVCDLEEFEPRAEAFDLIWVQWTLQYLIDADAVALLRRLGAGLSAAGLLVLKENAPAFEGPAASLFQVMAPTGGLGSRRFEITRPDAHHRLLFERAGLVLLESEPCPATETVVWVLRAQGVEYSR